jgi:plasmid replication initiation protein
VEEENEAEGNNQLESWLNCFKETDGLVWKVLLMKICNLHFYSYEQRQTERFQGRLENVAKRR